MILKICQLSLHCNKICQFTVQQVRINLYNYNQFMLHLVVEACATISYVMSLDQSSSPNLNKSYESNIGVQRCEDNYKTHMLALGCFNLVLSVE